MTVESEASGAELAALVAASQDLGASCGAILIAALVVHRAEGNCKVCRRWNRASEVSDAFTFLRCWLFARKTDNSLLFGADFSFYLRFLSYHLESVTCCFRLFL